MRCSRLARRVSAVALGQRHGRLLGPRCHSGSAAAGAVHGAAAAVPRQQRRPRAEWKEWTHLFSDKLQWMDHEKLRLLPAGSQQARRLLKELCQRRDGEIREFLRTGSAEAVMPHGLACHLDEFKVIHYLVQAVHNINQATASAAASGAGHYPTVTLDAGADHDLETPTRDVEEAFLAQPELPPIRSGYLVHYFDSSVGGYHPGCAVPPESSTRRARVPKTYCSLDFAKFVRRTKQKGGGGGDLVEKEFDLGDMVSVRLTKDANNVRPHGWKDVLVITMADGAEHKFAAKDEHDALGWKRALLHARKNVVHLDTMSLQAFAKAYPYCVEYEWEPSRDVGRGDVVFADGNGCFAVVEAKALRFQRSGPNQRSKRTVRRKQVREQALRYAHIYGREMRQLLGPQTEATAFVFTNDNLGEITVLQQEHKLNKHAVCEVVEDDIADDDVPHFAGGLLL